MAQGWWTTTICSNSKHNTVAQKYLHCLPTGRKCYSTRSWRGKVHGSAVPTYFTNKHIHLFGVPQLGDENWNHETQVTMVATLLASKTQFPSRIIQTAENDDNGIALGVLFSECLLLIRNQAVDPSFDLGSSSSYLNVKINLSVRCSTFFFFERKADRWTNITTRATAFEGIMGINCLFVAGKHYSYDVGCISI